MVEVVRERNTSRAISWLALVLAIVALVLAVMAYNRTGKNIDDAVRDAIGRVQQSSENAINDAGNASSDAIDSTEDTIDKGPDGRDDGTQ